MDENQELENYMNILQLELENFINFNSIMFTQGCML